MNRFTSTPTLHVYLSRVLSPISRPKEPPSVKTYTYRGYQVDLHPYAGGFKAFIFPPNGSGTGLNLVPMLVGPDGLEPVLLERLLRDVRVAIDGHLSEANNAWIH